MRILFYSDNFYPETSGISDSIIALARGLKARGHTIGFVGPRYSDKNYKAVGKTREEFLVTEGFEVHRIPSLPFAGSASGQARNVIPLGWSISFARRFRPDIIHTQTPFGTGFEALFASRILKIPLVGTNHTHIREFIKIYGPIRTRWAEKIVQRFFSWYYNRCTYVSTVAQKLVDEMREHGFKRNADVISNPLSLSTFSPPTEELRSSLRKELGLAGPTIIYAGRIAMEKRLDVVIRAFKRIVDLSPNASLVIAGNGPEEKEMRKLVSDLGLAMNVIFTGFLDHATLSKWYKAADVFVMMCPIETQCLALMQAFATALPSVGVKAGAVGEHIKPEFGLTVPDGDEKSLASALGKILSDPGRAKEMGTRALSYVQRFSESAVAKTWTETYEKAVFGASGIRKVSVVIPAHNEERVIAATLQAVLAQDYPDFEVIVVDNASTDGTADIARAYPVKVVSEPQKGLLAARERGRQEATGDIVVQMDADCLPEKHWLSRGVRHFKDERVSAVAGPYDYFDGKPFFRFFSLASQKYIYRGMNSFVQMLGSGAVLIGGNSFIRASALSKAGGYDVSIAFYGEDTDTAKRVSKQGRVIFDSKLIQKTSARRFKAEGTFKITLLYLFHFFRVLSVRKALLQTEKF